MLENKIGIQYSTPFSFLHSINAEIMTNKSLNLFFLRLMHMIWRLIVHKNCSLCTFCPPPHHILIFIITALESNNDNSFRFLQKMELKTLFFFSCFIAMTRGFALISGRSSGGLPYYLNLPDRDGRETVQFPKVFVPLWSWCTLMNFVRWYFYFNTAMSLSLIL